MFRVGDGTLFLKVDARPMALDNDRPRQPANVQRKVVYATQKNTGRNRPNLEHFEKMFGLSLQYWQVSNQVKRLVLDDVLPALISCAALRLGEFAKDHPAREGGEMIDKEDAVEVVDLVLQTRGEKP